MVIVHVLLQRFSLCLLVSSLLVHAHLSAQVAGNAGLPTPLQGNTHLNKSAVDPRVRSFIHPAKVVWQSENTATSAILESGTLVTEYTTQSTLENKRYCTMINKGKAPGILLDYGTELYGSIQIIVGRMMNASGTDDKRPASFRIRFGESASEAMSDTGGGRNATNDHSVRDCIVSVPWLGSLDVGNSGFRFVRIDLVDNDRTVPLLAVRGEIIYRDLEYKGSFQCSDTLVNQVWNTGAYTVHLCMQDFLWDGIKRDRLVWIGDMHPETMTILSVFGGQDVVKASLDLAKANTPLPQWMNGISSYSMWWLLIQRDYYMYTGDKKYLTQNKQYIVDLLKHLSEFIGPDGQEHLDGGRFLDWPSSADAKGVHAGLQALLIKTFDAGKYLSHELTAPESERLCAASIRKLKQYTPDPGASKQAAGLMGWAHVADPAVLNRTVLSVDPLQLSTFYGYYVLQARAMAGDVSGGLDAIRNYWGGMLRMGATTFWEDFDLKWTENASRIDALPAEGQHDVHGDYGAYCYLGFRLSLCHGWASGPTPWLSQYVLGISPVEPGFTTVKIAPQLGDLQWVKGTFPTPLGVITVEAKRLANGKVKTTYNVPKGMKVVR